jgi:hypothetical protein
VASSGSGRAELLHALAECLRGGTFEGKNPSPVEASTSARLLSYSGTPPLRPPKLDKPNHTKPYNKYSK